MVLIGTSGNAREFPQCEGSKEPIVRGIFIHNHTDNVLNIVTVLEERMNDRRHDQSLNLGECNTCKSVLK